MTGVQTCALPISTDSTPRLPGIGIHLPPQKNGFHAAGRVRAQIPLVPPPDEDELCFYLDFFSFFFPGLSCGFGIEGW